MTVKELEHELLELRAAVREWLCIQCDTVYPGPPRKGFRCVVCPNCGGDCGPRQSIELRILREQLVEIRTALKRYREQTGVQ